MQQYKIHYAYWGASEFLAGFFPKRNALREFHTRLRSISPTDSIVLFNSGRSAIRVALRAFKARNPGKNTVLVPAYTCNAISYAVEKEGLKIRYIDVDENLNMSIDILREQDFSDVLAIVAVHSNGLPVNIEEIVKIGHEKNVFVIDDAAQIQNIKHGDRYLGGYGDVGIYSFAMSKTLVSGESAAGGALLINNKDLIDPCLEAASRVQVSNNGRIRMLTFLFRYLWERKTNTVRYYFNRLFNRPDELQIVPLYKMNDINASVLLKQMDKIDWIIEGRKTIAVQLQKIVSEFTHVKLVQDIGDHYVIKFFFKIPDHIDRENVFLRLKEKNIYSRRPYGIPWAANNPECQNAEKLARKMIELPFFIGMSEDDIRHILTTFNSIIAK